MDRLEDLVGFVNDQLDFEDGPITVEIYDSILQADKSDFLAKDIEWQVNTGRSVRKTIGIKGTSKRPVTEDEDLDMAFMLRTSAGLTYEANGDYLSAYHSYTKAAKIAHRLGPDFDRTSVSLTKRAIYLYNQHKLGSVGKDILNQYSRLALSLFEFNVDDGGIRVLQQLRKTAIQIREQPVSIPLHNMAVAKLEENRPYAQSLINYFKAPLKFS